MLLAVEPGWGTLCLPDPSRTPDHGRRGSVAAQEASDTVVLALPPDAFADPGARAMIVSARAARRAELSGLRSYEGQLHERLYVGLTARTFRRERGVFEQERVARIRWSAGEERAVQWLGARRSVPLIGADTRIPGAIAPGTAGRASAELRRELAPDLLKSFDLPPMVLDPYGDRLAFGDDWAMQPLADTALAHYRYASGDALVLTLPEGELVLQEILVEPRRADFNLVAGSLWFDRATGALVRAGYRPSRPFDLAMDDPEESEDVPGFLQPVQGEITYITVEYSLHEGRFWLPRRFAMEGEARLGSLVRIPLTIEWRVWDYRVNDDVTDLPLVGGLPPGWARREVRVQEEGRPAHYVTVIVPPSDSLATSSLLSTEATGRRDPEAFTRGEIDDLQSRLQTLLPTYNQFRPDFAWGLEQGMVRYNRVEGVSLGVGATVPVGPLTTVQVEGRIALAGTDPWGSVAIRRGSERTAWSFEGYHQLRSMNPADDPFSLVSSLTALGLGTNRGQFYRASGAALAHERTRPGIRWRIDGFHERHGPVELGTDFHLLGLVREDSVAAVLPADRVTLTGARGVLRWSRGLDPRGLILSGAVAGELSGGTSAVRRMTVSVAAGHPLPMGLAGATEVAGGKVWGNDPPLQKEFFLGGAGTLRGFNTNEFHGPTFWRASGEMGSGFAGLRVALFGDMGWAGHPDTFAWESVLASAGAGVSLLDGLLRLDVARALEGGSRWKVHAYFDALF